MRTALPATPKQVDFINSLVQGREVTDEDMDMVQHVSSREQASYAIATLVKRPVKGGSQDTRHDDGAPVGVGYYLQTDTVYVVVKAKTTGRIYAKRLVTSDGGRARWEYSPGALRHLAHADRLTLEDAKAMGTRLGVCVVCGAALTDPKSIDQGIGPVCAAKL